MPLALPIANEKAYNTGSSKMEGRFVQALEIA
jgi:hypothetical protein